MKGRCDASKAISRDTDKSAGQSGVFNVSSMEVQGCIYAEGCMRMSDTGHMGKIGKVGVGGWIGQGWVVR